MIAQFAMDIVNTEGGTMHFRKVWQGRGYVIRD